MYSLMTESCCIMCVLHMYDLRSFSFSCQQLFVFVFGRILQWTIRYSAEYWKPIFGTALVSVLFIPVNVSTLLVGWQKDILPVKISSCTQSFFFGWFRPTWRVYGQLFASSCLPDNCSRTVTCRTVNPNYSYSLRQLFAPTIKFLNTAS